VLVDKLLCSFGAPKGRRSALRRLTSLRPYFTTIV
jgi:hypothetical protein